MGFLQSYHARRTELAVPDSVTPVSYRQLPAPVLVRPEPVLLPGYCNLYREPFLILAERHGGQLKLTRSEPLPSGFDNHAGPPATKLGAFPIESTGWTGCAHCGVRGDSLRGIHSVWFCSCERCDGNVLFHCAGHRGEVRCASGTLMNMDLVHDHPAVAVQGWRRGPAPQQPAQVWHEPPAYHAPPPMLQIAAPPSATLRIGFRGRQS